MTFDDKPSLAMTISEQTPAVQQAATSGANPSLTSLAKVLRGHVWLRTCIATRCMALPSEASSR